LKNSFDVFDQVWNGEASRGFQRTFATMDDMFSFPGWCSRNACASEGEERERWRGRRRRVGRRSSSDRFFVTGEGKWRTKQGCTSFAARPLFYKRRRRYRDKHAHTFIFFSSLPSDLGKYSSSTIRYRHSEKTALMFYCVHQLSSTRFTFHYPDGFHALLIYLVHEEQGAV